MGLIRIIIIALIVYLVIQIFRRWAASKNIQTVQKDEQQKLMVKCDVCQLHIPKSEALQKNGKYFCNQEHYNQE